MLLCSLVNNYQIDEAAKYLKIPRSRKVAETDPYFSSLVDFTHCIFWNLTSARCCNYSYMCSSWWVELPPETCRAVYRNIKTVYSRILLDNYWHCTLHSSPSVVTLRYWLFTKLGLLQKRKMCDIKLVTSYQTYSFCLYFYTSKKVAIGIRENGSRKGTWFLQYMNFLCLIQKHGNTGWA